nr:MAG: hypothetical protein DIU78_01065 [Pseudomonadota bacterium]
MWRRLAAITGALLTSVHACSIYDPEDLTPGDSSWVPSGGDGGQGGKVSSQGGGRSGTSPMGGSSSGTSGTGGTVGGGGLGGAMGGVSGSGGAGGGAPPQGGSAAVGNAGASPGDGTGGVSGAAGEAGAAGEGGAPVEGDAGAGGGGAGDPDEIAGGAPSAGAGGSGEEAGAAGADSVDGASGAGGEIGSAGAPGSGGSSTGGTSSVSPLLIDDCEDGDHRIVLQDGRNGYWATFDDLTGGTVFPPVGASDGFMSRTIPNTGTGEYAVYFAANGHQLGAGVGFELVSGKEPYSLAYDYAGIAFGARAVKAPLTIHVRLPVVATVVEGGLCTPPPAPADTSCFDHFFVEVDLTTSWKTYTVYWDDPDLIQGGWGYPAGEFDPREIVAIEWFIPTPSGAEIWIDDVRFVEK